MKKINTAMLGLMCTYVIPMVSMDRSPQKKAKLIIRTVGRATISAYEWSMQSGIDHYELQRKIKQRHYDNGFWGKRSDEIPLLADQQKDGNNE